MKKKILYTLLILLTTFSFLFSPQPQNINGPDRWCPVNYIHLNKVMGFSMNCDAIEYMGLSVNPGLIFQKNNRRQSRPLYLLSGSLAGYSIYYLSAPFHEAINNIAYEQFKSQIPKEKVSLYLSHYAGLVFINLIILVIAILLFEKIIIHYTGPPQNGFLLRYALLVLLISNHITKIFFWTPHQQMFNTLIPLLAIWLFTLILKHNYPIKRLLLISFCCGMLLLFYGSFLILLPLIMISFFYKRKVEMKQKLILPVRDLL
jgi:hypothetical protein